MVSLLKQYEEEFDVKDGKSIGKSPGDYVSIRFAS